jgi:hypothetical protein
MTPDPPFSRCWHALLRTLGYCTLHMSRARVRPAAQAYLRTPSTVQLNMQAACIPLTLSPAEQRYYMCELGLSDPQLQMFLAQLSVGAVVSDTPCRVSHMNRY